MSQKPPISFGFEPKTQRLDIADISPLHVVSAGMKQSPKYQQILASIRIEGLVEPPVVARDKDDKGKFLLLDGHLRLEALREVGQQSVACLIALDDEAYTYNKRISRIAIIQEHLMILKAIDKGVPEATLAKTLNVDIAQIRMKKRLLKGICTEVAELLKDRLVPMTTFSELRKMKPMRQIEAVELMIAMNKFSVNYARSLVGATPAPQLVDQSGPKKINGLSDAQVTKMEEESASLDREFKLIEESYGADNLDLVVATGYVGRLLDNARVVRFLAQHHAELLAEFQRISEPTLTSV